MYVYFGAGCQPATAVDHFDESVHELVKCKRTIQISFAIYFLGHRWNERQIRFFFTARIYDLSSSPLRLFIACTHARCMRFDQWTMQQVAKSTAQP